MSPIINDGIDNCDTYDQDDSGTPMSYTANALNQYTATSNPPESFTHDEDGNLIEDGQFTYTWDAENRLVAVQTRVDLGNDDENPDAGDKLIEFKYDYMNRRVEKRYRVYTSGDWADQTDGWQRFVYDEWNVVLVLDASDSNSTMRKYTWGFDLSGLAGNASAGGIHGAGGVGGLLAVEETATEGSPEYWFFYDANGNVGQVVNNATGYTVAAHYEYDPYGNVITSSGTYAIDNPIRFSTKWFDSETGLGYWGYRYYSPELGRWMSRDPIGELGGLNLYVYVTNTPIYGFDAIGLSAKCYAKCTLALAACMYKQPGPIGSALCGAAYGLCIDLCQPPPPPVKGVWRCTVVCKFKGRRCDREGSNWSDGVCPWVRKGGGTNASKSLSIAQAKTSAFDSLPERCKKYYVCEDAKCVSRRK